MANIVDKIRKLLELSKSTNEHEAAAAAARAADLMLEHQISEAELQAAKPEAERQVAPPARVVLGTYERGAHWQWVIQSGLADAFGGVAFYARSRERLDAYDAVVIGPEPATASIGYMYTYLTGEVRRLADAAYADEVRECRESCVEPPSARGWKGAFRVGAAEVIAQRLREQHRAAAGRARAAAAAKPATASTTTALAIIDQQTKACLDLARVTAPGLFRKDGKMRAGGTTSAGMSSSSGRAAGQAAGRSVNLGGGRQIGAGRGQLR